MGARPGVAGAGEGFGILGIDEARLLIGQKSGIR
jgi:hypothetical protein